jgi:xylulokinase
MSGPYLAGIDVGTTSVKAALFSLDGAVVRSWASQYPTHRPSPGHVEQDPRNWTSRIEAGLSALCEGLPDGSIVGLGLCSQVNTHVFVDEHGTALMPAILWQDGRCAVEAAELDAQIGLADRLEWWGAPMPVDASHVLSRIAHVRRHHPDVWARTRWVMSPKDYCIFVLSGEAVADPLSSFGVVDGTLRYIPQLIARVGDAAERLPPLRPITGQAGVVKPGIAGEGLPVTNTAMDAWTGLVGAGASRDGDAVYLSGTSEVGAIVSGTRTPTPGVIAFPKCEGIVLHAGPTQAGGASVEWLSRMIGRTAEEISTLAAHANLARPAPVFLPHLQGERAPLWDINARASFSGIDGSMGQPEFARAVLEGVAYSVRLLMDSLERSAGCKVSSMKHAGGGARSDVWCQIRADVLQRRLERVAYLDSGVLGAAMLAGVGNGLFGNIAQAAAAMVNVERVFEPDATQVTRHDEGFARYQDLYGRLKDFNPA